jgi:poly(A) polymerase
VNSPDKKNEISSDFEHHDNGHDYDQDDAEKTQAALLQNESEQSSADIEHPAEPKDAHRVEGIHDGDIIERVETLETKTEEDSFEAPKIEAEPEIALSKIDLNALWVVRRLVAKGYEAYLTGGCVRDLLLGRTPKDFDVATNAKPEDVRRIFKNCRLIGRRFLLAHVFFPGGKIVETATFRANPTDLVEDTTEDLLVTQDNVFGTVEEDARRRDLTVNGLFYDPIGGRVIDYVGGREDLERRVIRTIGEPEIRFREDPVRILRAIKFASRLGFEIEGSTLMAMKHHAGEITRCAPARVQEEIVRLLTSGFAQRALVLCKEIGILDVLMPELMEMQTATLAPGNAQASLDLASSRVGHERQIDKDIGNGQNAKVTADEDDEAAQGSLPQASSNPLVPVVPLSVDEREKYWHSLLSALDAVISREAHISTATAFAALLLPVYVSLEHSDQNERNWIDKLCVSWAERIRLARHDQDRLRILLSAIHLFSPEKVAHKSSQYIVRKPWFREALLLYILHLVAKNESLDAVGQWKALAHELGKPYRQEKAAEYQARPRFVRRRPMRRGPRREQHRDREQRAQN